MKTLLVGNCSTDTTFRLMDPDAPSEAEFEHAAVKALACAYPAYQCVLFGGTFVHPDSGARKPDLALVARDLSHWFVIEVELTSHSFDHHVLPQVRAFVFGEPQPDCMSVMADRLDIDRGRAETLVRHVPRSVAVVANRKDDAWTQALRALPAQLLVLSLFRTEGGAPAVEIDGELRAVQESLGFGTYSAVDRSLRFHQLIRLPRGDVQLVDEGGAAATWKVVEANGAVWATKVVGTPDFADGAFAQVVKTWDSRLLLRTRSLGR